MRLRAFSRIVTPGPEDVQMLLRYMQVEQVKTAPESHGDDKTRLPF